MKYYRDVSENSGTPKSSILIGISIINHPFWGIPIFGNTQIELLVCPIGISRNNRNSKARVVNP